MLTATRKRSRYARYPCVVTSHFCLLWQPVTSCVSSLCLHSWCTITDRIRFVCSPLKSIVDPIRLFVSSVSNRDFRERARVNQTNHRKCAVRSIICCGRFVYANEIIVLGDVSVGKHDRYKEKTTYMVWFTFHLEHSATLTLKSSEITFNREHCHDRGTFPAISQLLNEAPRL